MSVVPRITPTLTLEGRPRAPRYDTLDAWRGLACVGVVLYHSVLLHLVQTAGQRAGAIRSAIEILGTLAIGVPMFFVISGYCIAAAADNTRLRGGGVRTYFVRRLRRIYPPLWAAMGVGIVGFVVFDVLPDTPLLSTEPWIQPRPWWYSPSQWLGNLTLTETWRPYVFGDPRAHFPGQAWTLCYEEQFYLLTGLLLLAPRHLLRGATALSVTTAAMMVLAPQLGWSIDGFFFDGNWMMFAAGMLVYFAANYANPRSQVAVGVFLAMAAGAWARTRPDTLGVGVAFAAVLLLLKPWDRRLAASVALRPLAWCGQMCYSLYLVHQIPVKGVANAARSLGLTSDLATLGVTVPACLIVSLALGRAFYTVVERRFLNAPALPKPVPLGGVA